MSPKNKCPFFSAKRRKQNFSYFILILLLLITFIFPAQLFAATISIAVTSANPAMVERGTTSQITATTSPTNGVTKTYASNNPSVATVNSAGLITGVAVGTCTITITATSKSGLATSPVTVNVINPTVGITATSGNPVNLTTLGQTHQITTATTPSTGVSLIYATDNPEVATVNSSGLITATGGGTAQITITGSAATYNDGIATVTVNMSLPLLTVSTAPTLFDFSPGDMGIITPSSNVPGTTFTYSSSDPLIASVNNSGTVTAVADGVAVITALGHSPGYMNTPATVNIRVKTQKTEAFVAGWHHNLYLEPDGLLFDWGWNADGELGDGGTATSSNPTLVTGLPRLIQVAGTPWGTVVIDKNHNSWAWGYNEKGQVGNGQSGNGVNQLTPTQVKGVDGVGFLSNIIQVDGGYWHNIFLDDSGHVFVTGPNDMGQRGIGSTDNTTRLYPMQVPGLNNIIQIKALNYGTLALDSSGDVWYWGYNSYGQSGNGILSNDTVTTPTKVVNLPPIAFIEGGGTTSYAVSFSGELFSWGYNACGNLGIGTADTGSHSTPVRVKDPIGTGYLQKVSFISGGDDQCIVVLSNRDTLAFGYNNYGQIGNLNTGTNALLPTLVKLKSGANFKGVPHQNYLSAGRQHGMAMLSNHSVWGWGRNDDGEFASGLPMGTDSNYAVQAIMPVYIEESALDIYNYSGRTRQIPAPTSSYPTGATYSFASDNPAVATVNPVTGLVTGVTAGDTAITITGVVSGSPNGIRKVYIHVTDPYFTFSILDTLRNPINTLNFSISPLNQQSQLASMIIFAQTNASNYNVQIKENHPPQKSNGKTVVNINAGRSAGFITNPSNGFGYSAKGINGNPILAAGFNNGNGFTGLTTTGEELYHGAQVSEAPPVLMTDEVEVFIGAFVQDYSVESGQYNNTITVTFSPIYN